MAFQKLILSGSTNGRGIAVANTAIATGTQIHQVSATTTADFGDEVILYASNIDTAAHYLTIGFGGTSASDKQTFTLSANSTTQVMAGIPLQNALNIVAAADTINVVNIFGYVLRSS